MEYTITFEFSNNSAIDIIPFETFEELALLTAPYAAKGSVALSGGSTYDTLFEQWAQLPNFGAEAQFFPVDERVVPLSHTQSNWGNACNKLFTPCNRPEQCTHFATDVASYDALLHKTFGASRYTFSTIFLGVGDDGHTASLFPGDTNALESSAPILATESPKGIKKRITLGKEVLLGSKKLITILAGAGKKECLQWLKTEDITKPFVSLLRQKKHSTLFMESALYALFKEID